MNIPVCFFAATESRISFIFHHARPEAIVIIICLVFFSVFAWATMIRKFLQMSRARKLDVYFENEFRAQAHVLDIYDRRLDVQGCPMFTVYQQGCTELDARLKDGETRKKLLTIKSMEHIKRTLEGEVARECLRLESGLILLAIAVSGAPFLGLLGTVWGVMDTFAAIGIEGRATLETMAPGVSAALVTTVAGLLVAIPSMFAYNGLVHSLRVRSVELDNFAQSLVSRIETEHMQES
jgi:biopolymer transport protein ExbB/TolQ